MKAPRRSRRAPPFRQVGASPRSTEFSGWMGRPSCRFKAMPFVRDERASKYSRKGAPHDPHVHSLKEKGGRLRLAGRDGRSRGGDRVFHRHWLGTGQAQVGTSTPWSVTFGASTGTMYPGSGTSTVNYTVTNNGSGNQHLNTTTASVVADGSGNVKSSGTPVSGCLATWFSVSNSPPAGTTLSPSASTTGSAAVTMAESGTNQDACKTVTPDILISAS